MKRVCILKLRTETRLLLWIIFVSMKSYFVALIVICHICEKWMKVSIIYNFMWRPLEINIKGEMSEWNEKEMDKMELATWMEIIWTQEISFFIQERKLYNKICIVLCFFLLVLVGWGTDGEKYTIREKNYLIKKDYYTWDFFGFYSVNIFSIVNSRLYIVEVLLHQAFFSILHFVL